MSKIKLDNVEKKCPKCRRTLPDSFVNKLTNPAIAILLSTIRDKVDRMDKDETGDFEKDLENRGYNQALSDVLKLLSELEK